MSEITNKPKIKLLPVTRLREEIERRALMLAALLTNDEVDMATVAAVMKTCGNVDGEDFNDGTGGYTVLKRRCYHPLKCFAYETKVLRCTNDVFNLDHHYCPMVHAWQRLGLSSERIERLCDLMVHSEKALASCFDGELHVQQTIAHGAPTCEFRFTKNDVIADFMKLKKKD